MIYIILFWLGILAFISGGFLFINSCIDRTLALFITLAGLLLFSNVFIVRFIQISKKGDVEGD